MDQAKSVPANDNGSGKYATPAKNITSAARTVSTQASVKAPELADRAKAKVANEMARSQTEYRHAMIAEAAYLIAERRNFEPGHEVEDWLAAEQALNLS
jgi:Protein of unknown function (DUF2934)